MNQDFLEGPHLGVKRTVLLVVLITFQGRFDHGQHQFRLARHHFGQLLGGGDCVPDMPAEILKQLGKAFKGFGNGHNRSVAYLRNGGGVHLFAVTIEPEFAVIRQHQIVQTGFIACQLHGGVNPGERDADVFGFDIADGNIAAGEDIIRRAAGNSGRLVCHQHARVQGFQQGLQIAAIAVFSCDSCGVACGNACDVGLNHVSFSVSAN